MRIFVRFIPVVLILLSHGCVTPLDLEDYDTYKSSLVVDGMITDQPGPYTVSLFISSPVDTDIDLPQRVTGAVVRLLDDLGNQEMLTETSPGIYQTSANGMRGTIGRSYHVRITTNDKEYVSSVQKMAPAGSITELIPEFAPNSINRNDLSLPQHAVKVYFNSKGEPGHPNLFRWRWSSIYEVQTYPDLNVRYEQDVPVPDPFPCSGAIYEDGTLQYVDGCECCVCWVNESSNTALVSNNTFVSSSGFNKVLAATIPITSDRFFYKYYFKLEQLSMSEDVYTFWDLVQLQQNASGDIFQPNSINIKGNMTCTSDPDEEVLGVFAVSAIAEKDFFMPRSAYPVPIHKDTITFPCYQVYKATNIRPAFW